MYLVHSWQTMTYANHAWIGAQNRDQDKYSLKMGKTKTQAHLRDRLQGKDSVPLSPWLPTDFFSSEPLRPLYLRAEI